MSRILLVVLVLAGAPELVSERAIVRLTATTDDHLRRTSTGFVIAPENNTAYILTAAHVVEDAERCEVEFREDPSAAHAAEVLRIDDKTDLALLRIHDPPARTEALAISDRTVEAGN